MPNEGITPPGLLHPKTVSFDCAAWSGRAGVIREPKSNIREMRVNVVGGGDIGSGIVFCLYACTVRAGR